MTYEIYINWSTILIHKCFEYVCVFTFSDVYALACWCRGRNAHEKRRDCLIVLNFFRIVHNVMMIVLNVLMKVHNVMMINLNVMMIVLNVMRIVP